MRLPARLALVPVAALPLVGLGCAAITCLCVGVGPRIHVSSYEVGPVTGTGALLAGVGRSDITPPPGFPLGGHSIAAGIGRGYWTRLHARAFYFQDREAGQLVLVSCDLFAMPAGLQARVAERVRDLGLDRDHVILAATHTHQSPGNYLSSRVYNQFASPREGFNRKLFDFLTNRIAAAIRSAVDDARSDRAGSVRLVARSGRASGILRNRAVDSFVLNSDREVVLQEAVSAPPACPAPCERYRAVDDQIALLEILRRAPGDLDEHPIGLLVFFSGHPTAMSHDTALYNSDYVGLAVSRLERRAPEAHLVAGFFNGAEGDISPDWTAQNRLEALAFAAKLEAAIQAARAAPGETMRPDLRVLLAREDARARVPRLPESQRLAAKPQFGAAAVGGAEDGRTIFYDLGWRPGVRTDPSEGQGVKLPSFDIRFDPRLNRSLKLTSSLAPPCTFPHEIPVSLVRLDTFVIAALPVETTRTMWRRIRLALTLQDPTIKAVVPVGLADEYLSYVTTPEEYAAQGYEGASTIFGPWTGPVLQDTLVDLAAKVTNMAATPRPPGAAASRVSSVSFRPGAKSESFGPKYCGQAHPHPDEALETLIVDEDGRPNRHWPRFAWTETGIDDYQAQLRIVSLLEKTPSGAWKVRLAADGAPDDDSGANVLTVLVGAHDSTRDWAAIWLAPPDATRSGEYAFTVLPRTGSAPSQPVCSVAFRLEPVLNEEPPKNLAPAPCPMGFP